MIVYKFGEDKTYLQGQEMEKSKLVKKELTEPEKQVLFDIDFRINWWNRSFLIDYFAKLLNYAQHSKEVVLAYLMLH